MRLFVHFSNQVGRVLCFAAAAVWMSSCSEPPEVLELQSETGQLKDVVRDARKDVQNASDQLRKLQTEKREWANDKGLDGLRAEVSGLRVARDAAKADLAVVVEEFETMKETRLP